MPVLFYIVLTNLLVRVVIRVMRKRREPKPLPVCASCVFAHMQYAVGGKRAISCTFGGGMRPITIDVMYCTDYRDRAVPLRVPVVGFVPQAVEPEVLAEVAVAD